MDIEELMELFQTILNTEGRGLKVVTTGHYGEPYEYSKSNFHVEKVSIDEGLNPIKLKKVLVIDHIDIGPEPD